MESRMLEIRTYGLTGGEPHPRRRRGVGLYSTERYAEQFSQWAGGAAEGTMD